MEVTRLADGTYTDENDNVLVEGVVEIEGHIVKYVVHPNGNFPIETPEAVENLVDGFLKLRNALENPELFQPEP